MSEKELPQRRNQPERSRPREEPTDPTQQEGIINQHPHWLYLSAPGTASLISLSISVASQGLRKPGEIALAGSLAWLSGREALRRTDSLEITGGKVTHNTRSIPLLQAEERSLPIHRISEVKERHGPFERLLHSGTVTVDTDSEGKMELHHVRDPKKVKNTIDLLLRQRSTQNTQETRELSVAEQVTLMATLLRENLVTPQYFGIHQKIALLKEMGNLLDNGRLTPPEFEMKKWELLYGDKGSKNEGNAIIFDQDKH